MMKRIVALGIVLLLSIAIVSVAGADPFSPTETAKYFNISADEIMDLNAIDKATFTISLLVDLSGTSEIRFLENNLPHMLSSESYIQLNRPGVITVAFPCDSSILTLIYFADGESEITASYGYFDIPSAEYGKSVIENTISDYKTSVNDPTELVRALLYFKPSIVNRSSVRLNDYQEWVVNQDDGSAVKIELISYVVDGTYKWLDINYVSISAEQLSKIQSDETDRQNALTDGL